MNNNAEIEKNIKFENKLLEKLFQNIKRRNYYLDIAKDRRKDFMRDDLIFKIEDFFLRNNSLQYLYTENHEIPLLNVEKKHESWRTMEYYELSQIVYDLLEGRIEIFMDTNVNKDQYIDDNYAESAEDKIEFFLHSSEIVRKEIDSVKNFL